MHRSKTLEYSEQWSKVLTIINKCKMQNAKNAEQTYFNRMPVGNNIITGGVRSMLLKKTKNKQKICLYSIIYYCVIIIIFYDDTFTAVGGNCIFRRREIFDNAPTAAAKAVPTSLDIEMFKSCATCDVFV